MLSWSSASEENAWVNISRKCTKSRKTRRQLHTGSGREALEVKILTAWVWSSRSLNQESQPSCVTSHLFCQTPPMLSTAFLGIGTWSNLCCWGRGWGQGTHLRTIVSTPHIGGVIDEGKGWKDNMYNYAEQSALRLLLPILFLLYRQFMITSQVPLGIQRIYMWHCQEPLTPSQALHTQACSSQ